MLLTFTLALSFALPAMAAVNWDEFRIANQPQDLTIKHGDSFTLSVEVNVPDGVELEYRWRRMSGGSKYIENATTSELHISPDDSSYYPQNSRLGGGGDSVDFNCEIIPYVMGAAGRVKMTQYVLRSNTVSVQTERTVLGKILDVTVAPFWYAFGGVMATPAVSIPLFPFAYLYWLVLAYVSGFRALYA
jgi:hypothetical protein